AEDLLSIVHESDALSIRDALGKLQAAQGELDRAKEAFVDATHGRSFLPRLRKARPLSTSVTNAAEGVTQRADELRKQVDSFNSLMATLKDEQLPEASSLIDSVRANTDELATKGWQLAEFTEQLESLREKHQQAVTENERGYISGPATLVAEIVDSAHAIQAQLDTLDERHDNLVSTYKAQTSSMRQTPKLITDTKARVSSAVDTYGAENFADLNPDARLDELLASQRKAYTDLQPLTNILSIEALEAGETCITQFDETVAEIRKLSGEVDDRINAIAQLSEDLPVLYQELEMYLTDVVEDLDEFGDKTTDATRAEIMSLKSDIEASNQQVQTSKPNLHELSSQRESQQENLTKLAEKARAEAVEMGELWADVRQIPKETQAALDTLRTYTGANDDVSPTTHAAIASQSLPTIEPGDTRETLREQVALAQKLKQQVTGLRERAEADVAAAQRRREAARQAEIAEQAEEAERRRRNRARVSTPSLPRIGSSSHRSSSPSHSTSKRSSGSRPKGSSGGSKRRSGRI
ncbi:hypothetical protein KC957_02740, partial [Candidatus Saccharibacteria bacterium]|nr:hypothetical protein [Candidatus Saccharibacteria bacterium]